MRFKTLLLAAAVAAAPPVAAQAKTFRWSRSVDISTWDIHTQNVGVNNTMHGAVYDTLVEYNTSGSQAFLGFFGKAVGVHATSPWSQFAGREDLFY